MKKILILTAFFIANITISQIDTASIFKEINSLSNDSLVDDFWRRLDSCDQDLKTFENPILQTENLIKTYYFFKKFGYSNNCRFDKTKVSVNNGEMHSLYIWMHSSYVDLNYCTFPLIREGIKIYLYSGSTYPNYFLQNIMVPTYRDNPIERIKALNKVETLKFTDIDIEKLVLLANEYKLLREEILDSNSLKVLGNWKLDKFKIRIYKSKNGFHYFEALGNHFKLETTNFKLFRFITNVDGTYLEILEDGNLVNKDEEGNVIETFLKLGVSPNK